MGTTPLTGAAAYLDDLSVINPTPVQAKARRSLLNYVGPATLKAAKALTRRRSPPRRRAR